MHNHITFYTHCTSETCQSRLYKSYIKVLTKPVYAKYKYLGKHLTTE